MRFPGGFSACSLNVTGDSPVPGLSFALHSLPPLDLSISPLCPLSYLRSSSLNPYPLTYLFPVVFLLPASCSHPAIMGGDVLRQAPSSLPRAPDGPVGQRIRSIYTDRLKQFTSKGQYENQNLLG